MAPEKPFKRPYIAWKPDPTYDPHPVYVVQDGHITLPRYGRKQ